MNLLLLLPIFAALSLLTAGAWLLVQLLGQNGRTLLRIEALEARLAVREARGPARPPWPAGPAPGRPAAAPAPAPAPAPGVADRSDGAPSPDARSEIAPPAPPPARASQTSKGFCGKGAAPARLPVGEAAPPLVLPDLAGETVDLAAFRGGRTLVLFWNPGCGYCKRMLDDLRAWEADLPEDAPRLLVVSTGSTDANIAMGLRATIVLDRGFVAARSFGASGTPSAVLVDQHGRIVSSVARGAPAVLALAGARAATEALAV